MITEMFNWYEELPKSAKNAIEPVYMLFMTFIFCLICVGGFVIADYYTPAAKENAEAYQACVQRNIDMNNQWIESNYAIEEFKPYDCSKLL